MDLLSLWVYLFQKKFALVEWYEDVFFAFYVSEWGYIAVSALIVKADKAIKFQQLFSTSCFADNPVCCDMAWHPNARAMGVAVSSISIGFEYYEISSRLY